jgi:hypothetical protein
VFCPAGEKAEAAKAAGADIVGMDDLAEKMQAGDLNYDVVIATPDAMRVVGKLGQVLGPRGLMPNPKVGTVTPDVAGAVRNAKAGQVRFRNDKAGIIHCTIGKASFETEALKGNLNALLGDFSRPSRRPPRASTSQKVSLTSTHGRRRHRRPVHAVDQVIDSTGGRRDRSPIFEGSSRCESRGGRQRPQVVRPRATRVAHRKMATRSRLNRKDADLRRWCCPNRIFWNGHHRDARVPGADGSALLRTVGGRSRGRNSQEE